MIWSMCPSIVITISTHKIKNITELVHFLCAIRLFFISLGCAMMAPKKTPLNYIAKLCEGFKALNYSCDKSKQHIATTRTAVSSGAYTNYLKKKRRELSANTIWTNHFLYASYKMVNWHNIIKLNEKISEIEYV